MRGRTKRAPVGLATIRSLRECAAGDPQVLRRHPRLLLIVRAASSAGSV